MKTRLAVVFAAISALGCFCASAQVRPGSPQFTNYDKRIDALTQSPSQLSPAPDAAQAQAESHLKALAPRARVSRDPLLGTPRLVSAASGFLTGPGGEGLAIPARALTAVPADDPHRVIRAFLNEHSALFGQDSSLLASAKVERDYVTDHNGLHTTVWQQTLDGVPVFEAVLIGHVTRNQELVSISSQMVPNVARAADAGTPNRRSLEATPPISAAKAISLAAGNVGVQVAEADLTPTQAALAAQQVQSFTAAGFAGPARAELVWLPLNATSMRLGWEVRLTTRAPTDGYQFVIDAQTGEVMVRRLTTKHITPATYNVYTNDSPSPFTPGWPTPSTDQPTNVSRALITTPALDTNASPAGWVIEGPSPTTSGNNVEAFLDRNLDLEPDVALPVATNRIFNFPLNLEQPPTSYQSASTVQLFYRGNWYHDRLYQLGFTEAAGNYQVDNFGRGGLDLDPVICLVQAGADVGESDNSFFIPQPDGSPGYCAMFVFLGPSPDRDGSLDQEVVCHELTHGTSERLVGGGVGISQLQSGGMGEGWSDFYALCLLSEASDDPDATYPTGGYASYLIFGLEENYYYGIRRYPYSTDLLKNPLTFKDIDPNQASAHPGVPLSPLFSPFNRFDADEVHNQGEVWCVTLREVWANLVNKWGWEIGNELTLQLVTDGMKLAPPNPNFLEARDAIIQADEVDSAGENFAELWLAFAKRGLGLSASSPPSFTTLGLHEAFDLPLDLTPDGILEVRVTPPSGDIFFKGETNSIFVRVSDAAGVVNATITAVADNGTNVVFRNDGVSPDVKSNDAVYSTSLIAPTNQSTISITMVISAPGKTTSTNVITYFIIPLPANDYFTNATKVPAAGTNYFTSNKRATVESGEPAHGGIATAAASLWWTYTPAANTNVLVDSGGSNFRGIVAVYTNSTLGNLSNVASAVGNATRLGPFVKFNGRAGVTYRIAMSSFSASSVGAVSLNFAPGGQPDTNAPEVSITAPMDGLLVTTNRIIVSATVVDPGPIVSGIQNVFVNVTSSLGPGVDIPMLPPGSSLLGPVNTNWSSIVALRPGQNTIQVSATDFSGNRSALSVVNVTYRPPGPANDFFMNSIALTTNGVSTVNTAAATKEVGEPNHAGVLGGHSVWWSFTPAADGFLTLSTSNSTFDTVLAIYQGTSVSALTPIASNDDAYDGVPGGYSQIVQTVRSNQTYHIALDGFDGQSGIATLSYDLVPATLYHVTVNSTAGGIVNPTSADAPFNGSVVVSATPDPGYIFDIWDGSVVSLNNPLTVLVTGNMTLTAHFRPLDFTDGFETGNLRWIPWTTNGPANGNKPWFVQTNVVAVGKYAARSGLIANNQFSSLILTAGFRAGGGSFDYRVSSEPGFDVLRFLIDGVVVQQWSGEVGWANFTFSVPAGTHTLEWRYTKDVNGSSGLDAAFIDDVNLPLVVGTDSTSAAALQLQRDIDGTFFINVTGQTNQQYILQTSTNLFNWRNLSTNVAASGFLRFSDPASATNQIQFYRAVAVPQ